MGRTLDEEPCPKCKKPVSVAARKCPYCLTDYSDTEIAARKKSNRQALMVGTGALLAVFLAVGFCSTTSEQTSNTDTPSFSRSSSAANGQAILRTEEQRQFADFYRLVIKTGESCDAANTAAVKAIGVLSDGGADVYSAFTMIDTAEEVCQLAVENYSALAAPVSLSPYIQKDAAAAINGCANGYQARVDGLATAKVVLDGDDRPSAVQTYKEKQELAQTEVMLCMAGLRNSGAKLGMSDQQIAEAAN